MTSMFGDISSFVFCFFWFCISQRVKYICWKIWKDTSKVFWSFKRTLEDFLLLTFRCSFKKFKENRVEAKRVVWNWYDVWWWRDCQLRNTFLFDLHQNFISFLYKHNIFCVFFYKTNNAYTNGFILSKS